jgi:hypothetical protein
MGIRALDLRLTNWNGTLYHSHRFMTDSYRKVLEDLDRFTNEYPSEVFVI